MKKKVILISIDGMRPDGFLASGNPFAETLLKISAHSLKANTVVPPVTLPCHMSLFHSIPPSLHGILTNTYVPPSRPVDGLFDVISAAGGISAIFYGWEPMRDVYRPISVRYSEYVSAKTEDYVDAYLTSRAIERINRSKPDFVFLYMVDTDQLGGHKHGWMSPEYLDRIRRALDNVKQVYELFHEEYTIVITADHGGHDRTHGLDIPEDSTIPMFFIGEEFEPNKELDGITIMDIAPTIADIIGVPCPDEWEGRSLVK